MGGMEVTSAIACEVSRIVDMDRTEASGTAQDTENSKPLTQIALNPASAASLAVAGLWRPLLWREDGLGKRRRGCHIRVLQSRSV